jgi:hypothetical protein
MPTLKVTYAVPNTSVTDIVLEEFDTSERHPLKGSGEDKTVEIVTGTKYILRWRANGAKPSSEYTIKITAPEKLEWEPDPPKKSMPDGKIRAQHTFTA